MAGATERLAHVAELLPEICTLDCGTMNFGEGDYVMTNTPAMLKRDGAADPGARRAARDRDLRHRPSRAREVAASREGLLDDPVMVQLCMGIPWGAPDDVGDAPGARRPTCRRTAIFSAFSIGRNQLPYVGARGARRRQRPRRPRGQYLARARACWRRTGSWSSGRSRSLEAMGARMLGAGRGAREAASS